MKECKINIPEAGSPSLRSIFVGGAKGVLLEVTYEKLKK
jgi:hypothetical protein